MKARYVAIIVGLSISVFTIFYLIALLLLTEYIYIPSPKELALRTVKIQSLVDMPGSDPQPSPIPLSTAVTTEGLSVTDPRLVVLNADDVPRDLKVVIKHTRYVDNAKLVQNSANALQTQEEVRRSGRLNGFQTSFMSDDPVAIQLRSTGILNFAEIYETSTQAKQGLQSPGTSLIQRFSCDGQLVFENELTTRQTIGQETRSFQGVLITGQERTSLYGLIFYRKNTLIGIILLGEQQEKIIRDTIKFADLLDRRTRNFGKGQAALIPGHPVHRA
jgi:hypothetical protein